MWKNIEAAPADAILGLTEAFKNDDNNQKVNKEVNSIKETKDSITKEDKIIEKDFDL